MNVYLRNLHHVVRTYSRQAGRKSLWGRPKDPQDRLFISEEGRRMVQEMARRIKQRPEGVGEKEKRLVFKVLNFENGEEILKEVPAEEQGKILERLVAKIIGKGEGGR